MGNECGAMIGAIVVVIIILVVIIPVFAPEVYGSIFTDQQSIPGYEVPLLLLAACSVAAWQAWRIAGRGK